MCLLVFFGDYPRLDTIKDHVIYSDSISQMDGFLHSKNSQNLELDGCQIIE